MTQSRVEPAWGVCVDMSPHISLKWDGKLSEEQEVKRTEREKTIKNGQRKREMRTFQSQSPAVQAAGGCALSSSAVSPLGTASITLAALLILTVPVCNSKSASISLVLKYNNKTRKYQIDIIHQCKTISKYKMGFSFKQTWLDRHSAVNKAVQVTNFVRSIFRYHINYVLLCHCMEQKVLQQNFRKPQQIRRSYSSRYAAPFHSFSLLHSSCLCTSSSSVMLRR